MRIYDPCFWAPQRRGYGRREVRLHLSSFLPVDQSGRYSREGDRGDLKVLGFGMELPDVVLLVLVSDYELPDLPKRDVARLTHIVQKFPSADA